MCERSDFMYTLYIDTHCEMITIALLKSGKLLTIKQQLSNQQHSTYTLPMISDLLNDFKLDIRSINEILVVNGPGSFTGVRIGVTIAKTIAFTCSIPIRLISSLFIKAVSIKDDNKYVSLVDKHGAYVCGFDKSFNIIDDYKYLSTKDYNEYKNNHNVIEDIDINYEEVYEQSKIYPYTTPHSANPMYIKSIEALNDKKN